LATTTFADTAPRDVIDSTAEAFSLHLEHLAVVRDIVELLPQPNKRPE
jgi:hypothetical protein